MGLFDKSREDLQGLLERGRDAARRAGQRIFEPGTEPAVTSAMDKVPEAPLDQSSEPPVVARLMIEIRSDGSRTVARGALEDVATGQKVAVVADGKSPLDLVRSLSSSLLGLPSFVSRISRSLKDR
jgi:hypothetical protein